MVPKKSLYYSSPTLFVYSGEIIYFIPLFCFFIMKSYFCILTLRSNNQGFNICIKYRKLSLCNSFLLFRILCLSSMQLKSH